MAKHLLEVKNLKTSFYTHLGEVQAVRGLDFTLDQGEILGIVGESGSGKSVTSLSIMGLIDHPGKIKSGEIIFEGKNIVGLSNQAMSKIRGNDISMIFQDPMTSLNPVFKVGSQIIDVIQAHHPDINKKDAKIRAIELLKLVGIPEPETRVDQYPHQYSGGMRQRAMIAMALSNDPKLLIADEPTTALDVTIQAQILDLMRELIKKINISIILITHDLGVIAEICDKVIVMYGGMVMEKGEILDIFENPQHPYTVGLHRSTPKEISGKKERLVPIEGTPPDLLSPPTGCPFSPRCPYAMKACLKEASPLYEVEKNHSASCWLHHKDAPEVENYMKVEGNKS
jgi:oligopeptide transport system ATP-binding protein